MHQPHSTPVGRAKATLKPILKCSTQSTTGPPALVLGTRHKGSAFKVESYLACGRGAGYGVEVEL
jgi:hypothetical protein